MGGMEEWRQRLKIKSNAFLGEYFFFQDEKCGERKKECGTETQKEKKEQEK